MFFNIVAAIGGNWATLVIGTPQVAGLALPLVGNPGRVRTVAGCVLFAELFVKQNPFILEGLIASFDIREWADELLA